MVKTSTGDLYYWDEQTKDFSKLTSQQADEFNNNQELGQIVEVNYLGKDKIENIIQDIPQEKFQDNLDKKTGFILKEVVDSSQLPPSVLSSGNYVYQKFTTYAP